MSQNNNETQSNEISPSEIRLRISNNYSDKFINAVVNYITEKLAEPCFWKFEHWLELFLVGYKRARKNTEVPWIKKCCSLVGKTLLDLGCNTGCSTVVYALEGANTIGIDIDAEAIRIANMRAKEEGATCSFLVTDARRLPFKENSFDICVCVEILEHVPTGKERIIYEAVRILKPKGIIDIETPNKLYLKDHHDTNLMFIHLLPKKFAKWYAKLRKRMPKCDLSHYTTLFFLKNTIRQTACSIIEGSQALRGYEPPTLIKKREFRLDKVLNMVKEQKFLSLLRGACNYLPGKSIQSYFVAPSLRLMIVKD